MNSKRIAEILDLSTTAYRKGEVIEGFGERVKNLYDLDSIDKLKEGEEKVDCFSVFIGVNKEKCQEFKEEMLVLVKEFDDKKILMCGFGYKELAKSVGQNNALRLFGFGKVAGWWDIIGPYELIEGINKRSANEQFINGCLYTNWKC